MIVPLVLLALSLVGITASIVVPGLSDLLLLALPCAVASLWLLVRAPRPRPVVRAAPPPSRPPRWTPFRPKAPPAPPRWIVIDGSNVMHWKDGTPSLDPLREVLAALVARGWTPGVVFDANAGYLLAGRYQHHGALGRLIGLPEDRVLVAHKGTPADAFILASARDLDARIITNDRYRDWEDRHPEVREPGRLIRGGYRDGALWLDLDPVPA